MLLILTEEVSMPARTPVKQNSQNPNSRFKTRVNSYILLLVTLCGIEAVSRFLFPLPEIRNFNRVDYSLRAISPEISDRSTLRNDSYRWISGPDGAEFIHELNLYGFRDRQWQVGTQRRRIIFIGDSFVEGTMAEPEQTIPAGFRAAAEEDGQYLDIMNMGVSGAGVNEYTRLTRDAIAVFKPDDVVLVLFTNDLPAGERQRDAPGGVQDMAFIPVRYPLFMPRILQAATMVIEGERLPTRGKSPPFLFLPSVPHPANPWTFNEEKLSISVEPDIAEAMKRGHFNPFAPDTLFYFEMRLRQPLSLREHIEPLRNLVHANSVALHVVYLPTRFQVSDYYTPFGQRFSRPAIVKSLQSEKYDRHAMEVAELMTDLGLPFLDLTEPIREAEVDGRHLYWEYDGHMRGDGYTFVGRKLYRWWAAYELDLPRATFP